MLDEHRNDPNEGPPKDLARVLDPGLWHDCTERQRGTVLEAWAHDALIFERKLGTIMSAENPTARLVWQSKRILAGPSRSAAPVRLRRATAPCTVCDGSGWFETTPPLVDDAGNEATGWEQPWLYKCNACEGSGRA